jgi:hypothetical protein
MAAHTVVLATWETKVGRWLETRSLKSAGNIRRLHPQK